MFTWPQTLLHSFISRPIMFQRHTPTARYQRPMPHYTYLANPKSCTEHKSLCFIPLLAGTRFVLRRSDFAIGIVQLHHNSLLVLLRLCFRGHVKVNHISHTFSSARVSVFWGFSFDLWGLVGLSVICTAPSTLVTCLVYDLAVTAVRVRFSLAQVATLFWDWHIWWEDKEILERGCFR